MAKLHNSKKTEFYSATRKEWRAWLKQNHAKVDEIWLVYYKRHTGKPSIGYVDSVEEAICFGWIDGIKKRMDDQRYTHRFTPRKPKSRWSPRNIELAKRMIKEGKMTQAGLAVFNQGIPYDEDIQIARKAKEIPLTPDIEKALRANKKAWKNFTNLSPSCKKQYAGWIQSAKKQETIDRRIKEAIKLLEQNKKLGMK
jgi:uncharacterized protein YdeI (YjbR/CyaY-like superfamily)